MTHHSVATSNQQSVEQLAIAFNLFNQLSDNLGESYRKLQNRVEALNEELSVERSQRIVELARKEQLAQRLSRVMSCLPGGVMILDDEDRVIDVNPEGKLLLGQFCVGRFWSEILFENTRYELAADQYFKQSKIELISGNYIALSERVADVEGGGIVLVTDVTDTHLELKQQFRQERLIALGEMSAQIAHQLRTPLSAAILNLSQLSMLPSEEDTSEIRERVRERLHHIEELIDGMLDYVRGANQAQRTFSLSDVISEVLAIAELEASQRGGRVECMPCPPDLIGYGCPDTLLSALTCLVENAVQLSCIPKLKIAIRHSETWQDVLIEDNGPGIASEALAHIFTPYYTSRPGGTGLGLAIARNAADQFGGHLEVLKTDSSGTCFRFRIPRVECSEVKKEDTRAPAVKTQERDNV